LIPFFAFEIIAMEESLFINKQHADGQITQILLFTLINLSDLSSSLADGPEDGAEIGKVFLIFDRFFLCSYSFNEKIL